MEADESFLCIGGIFKNDDEVGLEEDNDDEVVFIGVDEDGDAGKALPLLESILVLELGVCLSFPLPDKTARALSSDALATSSEPRGLFDLSEGGAVLGDGDAAALLLLGASTCIEERRFDDFDSLASFLAAALASFSSFLRLSSSSSMDNRIASMTMSSSRLLKTSRAKHQLLHSQRESAEMRD